MDGEQIARTFYSLPQARGKITALEEAAHDRGQFLPEKSATFFVHAHVADDRESLRRRSNHDQNGVAIFGPGHAEAHKNFLGFREGIARRFVDDGNPDFPRGERFGARDRCFDFRMIQLFDKMRLVHFTISLPPRRHRSCRHPRKIPRRRNRRNSSRRCLCRRKEESTNHREVRLKRTCVGFVDAKMTTAG